MLIQRPIFLPRSATPRSPMSRARLTRFAQGDGREVPCSFYRDCWVLGRDPGVTAARLVLVDATRIVLRNVLTILKVSARATGAEAGRKLMAEGV